jgi:hypothetical protein
MREQVSAQIVNQRLRNGLMEYFSIVVEFPIDPGALSLNSLINNWEMWVNRPLSLKDFASPVFVQSEIDSIFAVDAAWEAFVNSTPKIIKNESQSLAQREWDAFASECVRALGVFEIRGHLPEDFEVAK